MWSNASHFQTTEKLDQPSVMLSIIPMSAVTIDVDYIAKLARLDLTAEEKEKFQRQLGDVLTYIDALNEVNVDDTEITMHPSPSLDRLREDISKNTLGPSDIIANAPESAQEMIRVPKVVEDA